MSDSSAASTVSPSASLDEQSGVLDRASFDERLKHEWQRARRAQAPLALLLLDIDHFGAYLKSHRRVQAADRLRTIATILTRALFRPGDVVARYDDDEFAVLLPAVHENGARVVAARIRTQINAQAIPHSGGEGGIVTVSIGVAALAPTEDAGEQQLVELCQGALAQAKRMGRDSIVSQDWMA